MREYYNKIYMKGFEPFIQELHETLNANKKEFIITANPETFMIGKKSQVFDRILKRDDVCIVPDGIGVVKAGNFLGYPIKERVTGVGIAEELLKMLHEEKKSLYILGSKQEVLDQLVKVIHSKYSGIVLKGYCNGYVKDKDKVFEDMVEQQPDVVMVALGIPAQELLIGKHYDKFEKGIFIGVGGSFDVLSGTKKRAPEFFVKCNLEWLYRIMKEPKRLGRFFKSNIRFIFKIIRLKFQ